jgi:hypothetical protein
MTDLEKYGVKTGDVWCCASGGFACRILVISQNIRKGCYVRGIDIGTGEDVKIILEEFESALYFRVGEVYKL